MRHFPGTGFLEYLARLYGVQTSYYDMNGRKQQASAEPLLAILRSLGAPVATLQDVPAACRERRLALWQRVLEPTAVAWDGGPAVIRVRLPAAMSEAPLNCYVKLSDGEQPDWSCHGADLEVLKAVEVEGIHFVVKQLLLPVKLPPGYHRLTLELPGRLEQSLLISAPTEAYAPPAGEGRGWGAFLPLYALQTEKSWGSGDFSALEDLSNWVSGMGGDTLATLPLLPVFPDDADEPSPYLPASRLLWNEFYLDVNRVPELRECPAAQAIIKSSSFQNEIKTLRKLDMVDYRRQMTLKRSVLQEMGHYFFTHESSRRETLRRFAGANPVVEDYARFRATGEKQGSPWPSWPQPARDGILREADYNEADRQYHLYVQWLAHEQMESASARAREKGVRLYLDLPVGVHPDSYDVWRERHAFMPDVVAGAPPDAVFTRGQDWGFQPLHPERIREGYRYVIAYLRHHLSHAGMLRLDHVMGLHRLFCIPKGMAAGQGVYLRYPAEELYAILTLESHRHKTVIVGEDLGMVPPYVRPAMDKHNLHRMYVLRYELAMNIPEELHPVPYSSVASLNTHDMPPFASFWQGLDIQEWQRLGLLDDKESQKEKLARQNTINSLSASLEKKGWLEKTGGDTLAALRACLSFLADSQARTVLVNLEDLWQETRPQNIPGLYGKYPNWQRKARYRLEEFCRMPRVLDTLHMVNTLRKGQSAGADNPVAPEANLLSEDDLYLFNEGSHIRLYEKLGSHLMTFAGKEGTHFAVWAPDARQVSVTGDFNGWNRDSHPLRPRGQSGIWGGFVPGVGRGAIYKYHIASRHRGYRVDKADPFAFYSETPPKTASVVWPLEYEWGDREWMRERRRRNALNAPVSIYELHIGSWRRVPEEGNRPLTYREMAPQLAGYVKEMGFTHVEFLPVMEHPFYGSWGYQTTGYFAPTSRYGTPQDFMYLIDHLHQHGIGVILDWVPSHFPTDEHGLGFFDGTHLYEHAYPQKGFHPDWGSYIFNYGRNEVQSFLLSSALFWLDRYHADGLRVDAVASMLYLDYSRKKGDWMPNKHGGRENLEAIAFLRRCNEEVYKNYPDVQTIAEESTAWPMVSRPSYAGGLGFGMKWDMGWMHDTLEYIARDPIYRKYHHNELTFRMIYAFTENFILPLSHDEVVHGKSSLLGKMPGDDWQKFANLRLLLGYLYAQPGKKLLFMGAELGQWREWHHDGSLDWHLLGYQRHAGIKKWLEDLNRLYRSEPALHELDCEPAGFEWIDGSDVNQSIISFIRKGETSGDIVMVVANFTPTTHFNYRVGVPRGGFWAELLNSDAAAYGGSGQGNLGGVGAEAVPWQGRPCSLNITVPPLAAVFFKSAGTPEAHPVKPGQ